MLDVLIKGGTLVDGSGEPSRQADLGIRDGRIVALGVIEEEARETVDATGKDCVYQGDFFDCFRVQGVLREIQLVTEIEG